VSGFGQRYSRRMTAVTKAVQPLVLCGATGATIDWDAPERYTQWLSCSKKNSLLSSASIPARLANPSK
jgi:hypothetical protein